MTKILGFDVSSTTVGWCLLEKLPGRSPILIKHGYFKPPKTGTTIQRLDLFKKQIQNILNTYKPDVVGIEDIIKFMAHRSSAQTIIMLGVYNRIAGLTTYEFLGKEPIYLPVMTIRSKLKNTKKLPKKEDMPDLVGHHLNMPYPYILKKGKQIKENNDVADATAVALTVAFTLP
jgi:Holliday junction resolvasome RuvABC endonuclease subunit